MSAKGVKKTYLHVPAPPVRTRAQELSRAVMGMVLSPAYWLFAWRYRVPGLRFHLDGALLGLRLLFAGKAAVPYRQTYRLLFWPMESTRYFEFDFVWRSLAGVCVRRYLDVSSPRLFPLIVLRRKRGVMADLMNPDREDLRVAAALVEALGLGERCHLHGCVIGSAPFAVESFDLITSISVVEHIPEDREAVRKMWTLLKPGGRLLLSVPCAAEVSEQYIDRYEYGVLKPDEDGFTFHQRLYDGGLLEEKVFAVTGQPSYFAIYGEKAVGALRRNEERKWTDPLYPFWREAYLMGRECGYFETIADLPGEGVIAMEFIKE